MRSVWNALSDPGLHVLAITMLLVFLALGRGAPGSPRASSRLVKCESCHLYHYQESSCRPAKAEEIAHARP